MANYRTTVILKTDIVDSTPRLAEQTQAEMSLQRTRHKKFIADIAAQHHGSVFQEEGDGYLIEFPSVTNAVLAAIDMHQNLRSMQAGKGEKQRLAIRAIITVGDILHQGSDAMGMTMSLTARIEKITPPNEIYLSHAAWLMLNKAEVQTSFVDEFRFKGFSETEKVYKAVKKQGIRVLTDQCIVVADANGFTGFFKSNSAEAIENFLLEYDDLMNAACEEYGGAIRQINGDLYFMTFTEAKHILDAVAMICRNWKSIGKRFNIGISIGVHKGNLYAFRSYVFGEDINIAGFLSDAARLFKPGINEVSVVASGRIRNEFKGTERAGRFQKVDAKITDERDQAIIKEYGAYWFVVDDDSR